MSAVIFEAIEKSYGSDAVLSGLSLEVDDGEFCVLFGAPGSGKSVLLRILLGLEWADGGRIRLGDRDATDLKPGERNIGYVPQSFALFPDRTVRQNIAYPLTVAGGRSKVDDPSVDELASLLGIDGYLDRFPSQLSGGQKQRVAIARGLVRDTNLFVLDDPLVGLDFKLRERLVDDLRQTREVLGATFLYATSDASEALALGSRIAVLHDGSIGEYDVPFELYRRPQQSHTMTNLCFPAANVLEGAIEVAGSRTRFASSIGTFDVELVADATAEQPMTAVVRPEHVHLNRTPTTTAAITGKAEVQLREDLGAEEIIYLDVGDAQLTALVRADTEHATDLGQHERTEFFIDSPDLVLFSGQQRIGNGRR